ncbi:MAG: hypothetical protein J3Q66DRAFT_444794 [Benniella sp.]|nr:MAG: hypothetical protein J3Q66DRAFT_444794 [Benniella sp.]
MAMPIDRAPQIRHPLVLPELLSHVSLYLNAKDVLACSLVSRAFQAAFEPYVWRNLHIEPLLFPRTTLRRQDPLARFISIVMQLYIYREQSQLSEEDQLLEEGELSDETLPTEDSLSQVLQRAAPWIRSLSIHQHSSTRQLEFGERCTMLDSLSISGPPWNDRFDATYWDSCRELVRQNTANLRSLTMIGWNNTCEGRELPKWTPVSECAQSKNLRSLVIKGGSIDEDQRASYWQVFENLEAMTLDSINMAPPLPISGVPTTRLPNLRTLILNQLVDMEPVRQLDWLVRICPMLQTLEWTLQTSMLFPVQFTQYFVGMTWPELDSITIKGHRDNVSQEDYISILQAAQQPF